VTIGAVYASDLSRVRISCTAAPALADYATIERSVDQIRWFTVRGGTAVPLVGNACQLDDYEFVAGQANYYRATYVDTADPSVVAVGAASSGNNTSVTPGLPAGIVNGDVLVLNAMIRNTAGSVNTPAGWTLWSDGGNFRVFVQVYAGQAAPTVTFAGGVAGADTSARITAVRNSDYSISQIFQANASAQNIAFPAMASAALTPNRFLLLGWKQSPSSGATLTGWTPEYFSSLTAGDDATVFVYSKSSADNIPVGTLTVTGGVAAISEVAMLRFTRRPFVSQETANVTPTLSDLWLKNIAKPFLNRKIVVTDFSDIDQPSRSGVFDIVARHLAVAVTEVRGGNQYTLTVKTETDAEVEDLKSVLRLGDTVMLHMPSDFKRFPGGYYLVGNLRTRRALPSAKSPRRYHELPLTEVAAPSPAIVGTTVTWQGIISSFATWTALIAAEPTWAEVMDRIGTPSDVVVP
jgi:hypothetical protein